MTILKVISLVLFLGSLASIFVFQEICTGSIEINREFNCTNSDQIEQYLGFITAFFMVLFLSLLSTPSK